MEKSVDSYLTAPSCPSENVHVHTLQVRTCAWTARAGMHTPSLPCSYLACVPVHTWQVCPFMPGKRARSYISIHTWEVCPSIPGKSERVLGQSVVQLLADQVHEANALQHILAPAAK